MEISPDELCSMIKDPCETPHEEVIELVDTYLCTSIDLIIESIHERVVACSDRCRSKKHVFCNRLITSILHQVEPLRTTSLISEEGKQRLNEMEALLPKKNA